MEFLLFVLFLLCETNFSTIQDDQNENKHGDYSKKGVLAINDDLYEHVHKNSYDKYSHDTYSNDELIGGIKDLIKKDIEGEKSNSFDGIIKFYADKKVQSSINKNTHILSGNARIEYGKNSVIGDKIKLDLNEGLLRGMGGRVKGKKIFDPRVMIQLGAQQIYSDRFLYGIKSNKGLLKNAISKYNDFLIRGASVKKDFDDIVYAENVCVTTCNATKPHFAFILHKVGYKPNKKIIASKAHLMINGTLIPIPFMFAYWFPQKKKSGFIYPSTVNRDNHGFFIKDLGYYLYCNEYIDCTIKGSIYTDLSLSGNIVSNYILNDGFKGNIGFSFSSFAHLFNTPIDTNSYPVEWGFKWNHSTTNSKYGDFSADVDIRSVDPSNSATSNDGDKRKNFRSNISYSKNKVFNIFSFKAFTDYNKDFSNGLEVLQIPHVNIGIEPFYPFKYINLLCSKLSSHGTAIDDKIISITPSFDTLFKVSNEKFDDAKIVKKPYERDEKKKQIEGAIITNNVDDLRKVLEKASGGFKLYLPCEFNVKLFKGIDVSLFFNHTERLCNGKKGDNFFHRVYDWNCGCNVNTTLYSGIVAFNPSNIINFLSISNVRHKVSPSLSFTYSPGYKEKRDWYEPVGSGDNYKDLFMRSAFGNAPAYTTGILNFGVGNVIEAKILKNKKSNVLQILKFDINSGYDFLSEKCNWKDIKLNAQPNLGFFDVTCSATFDMYAYREHPTDGRKCLIKDHHFNKVMGIVFPNLMDFSFNVAIPLKKSEKEKKNENENENNFINRDVVFGKRRYSEFYIWKTMNLSITYRYDFSWDPKKNVELLGFGMRVQEKERYKIVNKLGLTSDFKLTKYSDISISIYLDFQKKSFTTVSFSYKRDLHCWTFSFSLNIDEDKYSISCELLPKSSALHAIKVPYDQTHGRL